MFEQLDNPNPWSPSTDDLAPTVARARHIRRRQMATRGGTGVATCLAIGLAVVSRASGQRTPEPGPNTQLHHDHDDDDHHHRDNHDDNGTRPGDPPAAKPKTSRTTPTTTKHCFNPDCSPINLHPNIVPVRTSAPYPAPPQYTYYPPPATTATTTPPPTTPTGP